MDGADVRHVAALGTWPAKEIECVPVMTAESPVDYARVHNRRGGSMPGCGVRGVCECGSVWVWECTGEDDSRGGAKAQRVRLGMLPLRDKHGSYGLDQLDDLARRIHQSTGARSRDPRHGGEDGRDASFLGHDVPVPDDELVSVIRAWCDPKAIRDGALPNGANQVAVLGVIIAEAGRRELTDCASIIVEFCAWPHADDFWVHLVPRALRALKCIGDLSIAPRLEKIGARDGCAGSEIAASVMTMRGQLPPVRERAEVTSAARSRLAVDAQATIVLAAAEVEVLDRDGIVRWADQVIERETEPPWWVCDLAVATDIKACQELLLGNSQASTVRRQLQVLAWAAQNRRVVLPEALTKMWYVLLDAELAKDARRDPLVELLFGAVLEWFHQETEVQEWRHPGALSVRDRLLAKWFEDMGMHGPAIDGPVVDAWLSPETLDKAGKALHRRLTAIIDSIVADAPKVRHVLEGV